MDKNYNVDDILAEIKRKKEGRQGSGEFSPPPRPAAPPRQAPPPAYEEPAAQQPFPFEAVSAQAGGPPEPPVRESLPKGKNTPLQSLLFGDEGELEDSRPLQINQEAFGDLRPPVQEQAASKPFAGKFRKPAGQQEAPPPNPFAAGRHGEASSPFQEKRPADQPKIRTNWSSFDTLEEPVNNSRTQTSLPRLREMGGRRLEEDALGFGEATQELPSRIGRRLGRGGVQMDFGMEEQEPPRETALTKAQGDLEPINDYNSPADKAAIIADFIKIKKGLVLRLAFSMLLLLVSLYLSFAAVIQAIPLPEFMWPETNLRLFLTAHTAVGMLSMLVCCNIVGAGLISLFKMRSDSDTLPALAGIAAVVYGIVCLSRPEAYGDYGGSLLFSVSILCFIFNLLGKIMLSNRIARNFKLVSSDCVKYSMELMDNKGLMRGLTKGLTLESYEIAYPQPTIHLAAFLDHSYSEDKTDLVYRFLAPICLAGAFVIALVSFFMGEKNLLLAAHAFAAILAVCASFTTTLIVNLPLDRLSSFLTQEGGMVSGYSAVEECAHLDGLALYDYDLIHPDQAVLHGIKTFDESRIDEVIVDAASVILSREGTLTAVFNQLIGGNAKMLRPVADLTYEDGMGISAWVDGKQVLIGSRELLQQHGIAPPPQDFEDRFTSDEREVLYLSSSGQLCAMFVVSYRAVEETLRLAGRLARQEMYLFIHTCNPNLSAEKLSRLLDYPQELIRIFPAGVHKNYEEQCKLREKAPAAVGFMGKNMTMVKSILGAVSVRGSITAGLVLQLISIMLGYGLISFLAIQGDLAALSFTHLLLYHGVWTALILLIPNLRKLV